MLVVNGTGAKFSAYVIQPGCKLCVKNFNLKFETSQTVHLYSKTNPDVIHSELITTPKGNQFNSIVGIEMALQ